MASHANPPVPSTANEQDLTRDQWWDLFDKVRLSQQPDYDTVGGTLNFLRQERDADTTP